LFRAEGTLPPIRGPGPADIIGLNERRTQLVAPDISLIGASVDQLSFPHHQGHPPAVHWDEMPGAIRWFLLLPAVARHRLGIPAAAASILAAKTTTAIREIMMADLDTLGQQ
jgi:hypothetical protein